MARRTTTTTRQPSPTYDAVRRLERLEGGAALFYEVSRQGKWVMVRSGHVGLAGQTRMREYPTPPAASVAMERLVADRLDEGWQDPAAETSPTGSPEPRPGRPKTGEVSKVPAAPDTRTVQSAPTRGGRARAARGKAAPEPKPATPRKKPRAGARKKKD